MTANRPQIDQKSIKILSKIDLKNDAIFASFLTSIFGGFWKVFDRKLELKSDQKSIEKRSQNTFYVGSMFWGVRGGLLGGFWGAFGGGFWSFFEEFQVWQFLKFPKLLVLCWNPPRDVQETRKRP